MSEFAHDEQLSPKLKEQFEKLPSILSFANDNGLNVGGAYQTYIHQDQPYVSALIQAAYPDRLESVYWWFPVVGKVPYIGFFHKEERDKLSAELASQGFDINPGYATAFSGLGYFNDPIFTSMLRRSDTGIAHLFFHELTHRTIWLPGSVLFNENLAEFIGEELTQRFFTERPTDLKSYYVQRSDSQLYKKWLKELRESLTSMYKRKDLNRADKLKQKELIFKRYTTERLPRFESDGFNWVKTKEWNNAVVLASTLYSPDTEQFRKAFDCVEPKTIKAFIGRLKAIVAEGHKGLEILKVVCEQRN